MKSSPAFTIIELLVVVSIIGILSTFIVIATSKGREKAKVAEAQSSIRLLRSAMMVAQQEAGSPLVAITADGCSECACRTGLDMRNTNGTCFINWQDSLIRIQNATNGVVPRLSEYLRDPWGSPYALDENEGEMGLGDCRRDTLRSMGPDGIYGNTDDIGIDTGYGYANILPSTNCP